LAGTGVAVEFADFLLPRLISLVPGRFEALCGWLEDRRERIAGAVHDPHRRERLYRRLLDGPVGEHVLAGRESEADEALTRLLRECNAEGSTAGEVYLIGGGPGDPDLLTLRAVRLLRQADVVLYDRLVAPAIVDMARPDAERVYVGKQRDRHPVPQESINAMLLRLAGEGKRVARLKGGDPFIFGRGGEEIDSLMEQGIPFQVVPGITAASGCAAYAGIPLTHRDHAQSCVFVTGHRKANGELALDFDALVRPGQTVVFYMGLAGLQKLADGLVAAGMSAEMPAALVQQGTTGGQVVVSGGITELPRLAAERQVRAPTLVIVGEVVRLRERLAWFQPSGPGPGYREHSPGPGHR
jgi:uroporphyrin-III C-methyltransferase/precorrin-2 dehydrogenase/sirohydrochlorin ferrochelatase